MATTNWTGATDADFATPGNWDNGVPTSGDTGLIAGSNPINFGNFYLIDGDIPDVLDFTGYTGQFNGGGGAISAIDEVTFSAGMTFHPDSGTVTLATNYGTGVDITFDTAGLMFSGSLQAAGAGRIALTQNLTMDSALVSSGGSAGLLAYGSGIIDIGANTITLKTNNIGLACSNTAQYDWTGAGKIVLHPVDQFGAQIDHKNTETLPPLEIHGVGSLYQAGQSVKCQSWLSDCIDGLIFDVDYAVPYSVTTIGNFSHAGGAVRKVIAGAADQSNLTIVCGGDFDWSVSALNGLTGEVTGAAVATGIAISNCDFSGGSELQATGCVDGGGNVHVNFSVKTTNSAAIGAGAGF